MFQRESKVWLHRGNDTRGVEVGRYQAGAVRERGGRVFAALAFENKLAVVDANGAVAAKIDTGIAPVGLAVDAKGGVAYAMGVALYQSVNNGGTSFSLIHTFPSQITAMSMGAIDSNTMWVGLADGTVQRTENVLAGANSSWTAHLVRGSLILVDDTNWDEPRRATLDFIAEQRGRYELLADRRTAKNVHPTFWNGFMLLRRCD